MNEWDRQPENETVLFNTGRMVTLGIVRISCSEIRKGILYYNNTDYANIIDGRISK